MVTISRYHVELGGAIPVCRQRRQINGNAATANYASTTSSMKRPTPVCEQACTRRHENIFITIITIIIIIIIIDCMWQMYSVLTQKRADHWSLEWTSMSAVSSYIRSDEILTHQWTCEVNILTRVITQYRLNTWHSFHLLWPKVCVFLAPIVSARNEIPRKNGPAIIVHNHVNPEFIQRIVAAKPLTRYIR